MYIKNLQGDIISIVDYDGNIVVNYTYDSFGKVVSITGSLADTIGQLNPMRYREYYYDSETGLYYLQSRYYDAEMQRFINADDTSVLGASGTVLGCNLYAYCENNPVMMVDSNGAMAVAFLRMMSLIYNKNVINSSNVSLATFALNGLGIYTAFHEIAQLCIAKELSKRGYTTVLEYGLGKKGEADVIAYANWYSCKYVWEVKPLGGASASSQLIKYTSGTGLRRGFYLGNISNIPIIGNIKMNITFDRSGGAYYAFYWNGKRITNAELFRSLKYSMMAACALATAIIIATVVEDIASFGIGLWNDALSFVGAGASMVPILIGGLKIAGYV